MAMLLLGMLVFFGIHLLPLFASQRQALVDKLGYGPYLGLFALLSLLGFGLLLYGYGQAPRDLLWSPAPFARPLAMAVMPLAFILLLAAYLPCHLRARLKHPMLIATLLWATVHLLANGDLASTLLFGGFLGYALVDIGFSRPRQSLIPKPRPRTTFDLIAVVAGLLAYAAVMHLHQTLFGVAIIHS